MVKRIENSEDLERIFSQFSGYNFAQSQLWYQARKRAGNDVRVYVYFKGEIPLIIGVATVQKIKRFWRRVFFPFGPVFNFSLGEISGLDLDNFVQGVIKDIGQKDMLYVQIDPFSFDDAARIKIERVLEESKSVLSKKPLRHTDGTMLFDTKRPMDENVLKSFRKATRYDINRAIKENRIRCEISTDVNKFEEFWKLFDETKKRVGFSDPRRDLFLNMIQKGEAEIAVAYVDNEAVSTIFLIPFKENNSWVTFLSASSDLGNRVRATTFLYWFVMNLAHERGYEFIDFYAFNKSNDGFTFFKQGFSGVPIWYANPRDYVVKGFFKRLLNL